MSDFYWQLVLKGKPVVLWGSTKGAQLGSPEDRRQESVRAREWAGYVRLADTFSKNMRRLMAARR
jgi:hypothetical protein